MQFNVDYQKCGVIVCLDVPEQGVEIGIDCSPSWIVGEKFRGIKLIPPGPHFLFYNSIHTASRYFPEEVQKRTSEMEIEQNLENVSLASGSPSKEEASSRSEKGTPKHTQGSTPKNKTDPAITDERYRDPILNSSPKIGKWFWIQAGDVLIQKWNPLQEDFYSEEEMKALLNETQRQKLSEAVFTLQLDSFLGAYPQETYASWQGLSRWVTKDLIKKLSPIGGAIYASDASFMNLSQGQYNLDMNRLDNLMKMQREALKQKGIEPPSQEEPESETDSSNSQISSKKSSQNRLSAFTKDPSVHIPRFSHIPQKLTQTEKISPEALTQLYMDKSQLLDLLLNSEYPTNKCDVLGELQFAFISFFLGQAFDGFEQWKHLILLISYSETFLLSNSDFFSHFLQVLFPQLERAPQDFFVDVLSQHNFLVSALSSLFEILQDHSSQDMKLLGSKFKEMVQDRFKYQFDAMVRDEDDEDAPVVVNLDEIEYF